MELKQHYQQLAHDMCPIYSFINMEVVSISCGLYRSRIPLNASTQNHLGVLHAGPIWMVAEYLGGLVVMDNLEDRKYQPVVANLTINFLRPSMTDAEAELRFSDTEAEAMRTSLDSTGHYEFSAPIIVKDKHEKTVAEARGNYVVKDFSNLMDVKLNL